jgi:hypothetical protein
MLPEIWGKYGWDFIHLVTMGYPEHPTEDDKKNYHDFIYSLQNVLPCSKCGNNLKSHLKKHPLTNEALSNRTAFVRWGIDLHNIVNYYTGKRMISYEEAMKDINKLMQTNKSTNNALYYILVALGIIIICYLIYYFLIKKRTKN